MFDDVRYIHIRVRYPVLIVKSTINYINQHVNIMLTIIIIFDFFYVKYTYIHVLFIL